MPADQFKPEASETHRQDVRRIFTAQIETELKLLGWRLRAVEYMVRVLPIELDEIAQNELRPSGAQKTHPLFAAVFCASTPKHVRISGRPGSKNLIVEVVSEWGAVLETRLPQVARVAFLFYPMILLQLKYQLGKHQTKRKKDFWF